MIRLFIHKIPQYIVNSDLAPDLKVDKPRFSPQWPTATNLLSTFYILPSKRGRKEGVNLLE